VWAHTAQGDSWTIKESVLRAHPVLGDGNYTPGALGPGGQPLPDMTATGWVALDGFGGNTAKQLAWLDPKNDGTGTRVGSGGAVSAAWLAEATAADPGGNRNAHHRDAFRARYTYPDHKPRWIYWYDGGWQKAEYGTAAYDVRTGFAAQNAAYAPRPFSGSGAGPRPDLGTPGPAAGIIALRFTP
jgi:hypothetical protein